jgi:hypothetical protein
MKTAHRPCCILISQSSPFAVFPGEGLREANKKTPNTSGPEYSMMPIVIALLAPFEVCMPPPLNIFNVFCHCSANMGEKVYMCKYFLDYENKEKRGKLLQRANGVNRVKIVLLPGCVYLNLFLEGSWRVSKMFNTIITSPFSL